jgi:hypothetical protein
MDAAFRELTKDKFAEVEAELESKVSEYEEEREKFVSQVMENCEGEILAYQQRKEEFIQNIQRVLEECHSVLKENDKRDNLKEQIKEEFGSELPIYLEFTEGRDNYQMRIYLPFRSHEDKSDLHNVLLVDILNEKARDLIHEDDITITPGNDEKTGVVFYEITLNKSHNYDQDIIWQIRNEVEKGVRRGYSTLNFSEIGIELDLATSYRPYDGPVEDLEEKVAERNGGRNGWSVSALEERRNALREVLRNAPGREMNMEGLLEEMGVRGYDLSSAQVLGDLRILREAGQVKKDGETKASTYCWVGQRQEDGSN